MPLIVDCGSAICPQKCFFFTNPITAFLLRRRTFLLRVWFHSISFQVKLMIRILKVKEQQKKDAENGSGCSSSKKYSAVDLRLQKDISELNLPNTTTISFPNGANDLINFEVNIKPDEGYYVGGTFKFTFEVPVSYPHVPPKVRCKTKIYHPNIDLEGNVCLNIIREDWNPVLSIGSIIYGLNHLFLEPNEDEPLNLDAAAELRDNPQQFETNVRKAMQGGLVGRLP